MFNIDKQILNDFDRYLIREADFSAVHTSGSRIFGICEQIVYIFRTSWEKPLLVFSEVVFPIVEAVVCSSPYRNIRRKEKRKKSAYLIADTNKVLSIG